MELTNIMLDHKGISLLVTKNFETMSYVLGYHVYKTLWIPVIEECLLSEREPGNLKDKYAVCVKKENRTVGRLPLGKSGKFAKTIFCFFKGDKLSYCKIEVTGKHVNLGDSDGMQVPCKLMFTSI